MHLIPCSYMSHLLCIEGLEGRKNNAPVSTMSPRKESLSKAGLRQITSAHGIRFEGPTPPGDWPDECKNHFQVIRSLQFLPYEKYRDNEQVPCSRREKFQKRVRNLRDSVRDLLNDENPCEDSWRKLEGLVFERFERPVICGKCGNELSKSDYEAKCLNRENQIELDAKRNARKFCACRHKRPHEQIKDPDEERGKIFCSVNGEPITHVSGDNLENSKISMRPDLVIGLRASPYIARSESHFPAKGRNKLLLPFLVLEAKKEKNAPGFRAIQYQTAFPVRRFLKAQADMDSRDSSCEPCLVWFFAYQGEQWRLHAGTIDRDKVRVFDLWQGTIQSQDGALQLLLIVDYIWSWARDVYRPTIRKLISNSPTSFRGVSPVSTDRFRHSVSLCPLTSSTPTSQDPDQMQTDEIVVATNGLCQPQAWEVAALPDASCHTFLRWAVGHEMSPSWTGLGSIRHSNLVHFEFRCYNLAIDVATTEEMSMAEEDLSLYSTLCSYAVTISPEQLYEIAAIWTTRFPSTPGFQSASAMRATFFVQTYCDQSTWQIKRVLNCIIWAVNNHDTPTEYDAGDLLKAMLQIRNIHGRESVYIALQDTGLVLQHTEHDQSLNWESFAQAGLSDTAVDTLRGLRAEVRVADIVLQRVSHDAQLLWVERSPHDQYRCVSTPWEQDTRSGDSMLAIRSPLWPLTCPKFCLFVLPEVHDESSGGLHRLLEEAMSLRNFYVHVDHQWGREDTRLLRQWRKALSSEKTIVA
ncbi:hypothetical protein BU25DRAFT_166430 [Macroventuria anomochaeta]|uniref:Uncharacterized protein n=1 Tax=Macroventuria anomochaeta TaxID=301207 RepID=A0ACB6RT31_9PLEO|nr:uncharacterized protein BU25DRAFT_166430 [Macroventuria anomochaeta]KAF2624067.1 hypothetical protein BU25DRAFT_166430 [Macroventuria anomochaeta]